MKAISRRDFCSLTAMGVAALSAPRTLTAFPSAIPVSISIDKNSSLAVVPPDFMGLSYESGQLAYPDFFSPRNTALVALFRTLSPAGVLRLGGNLSEFTEWSENEPAVKPEIGGLVGPDPGQREPRTVTITPRSIRNLQGFLSATGWRCIYGLNLGGGTLEQALAEGAYVAKTLGEQLMYVQFGNEPDLFKHHDEENRPWTCEEFIGRWKTFRAAFRAKLPHVDVAGPDTAFNQQWVKQFVAEASKEVVMATSHYYPEGPPSDPKMTIDFLLRPGARFESSCREAIETAHAAVLPFRMTEGNSCFNAGKPGVSDTFASALWAGDYCLQMAALGCVGVNLHGGANGFYSPIVGSVIDGFTARPEYFGLVFAQQFAGSTLHRATLGVEEANLTAYAATSNGAAMQVAIFNKDARDVDVTISEVSGGLHHATVDLLAAPAIDSKTSVTFEGSSVDGEGRFHPLAGRPLEARAGKLRVQVPAHSAALIRCS